MNLSITGVSGSSSVSSGLIPRLAALQNPRRKGTWRYFCDDQGRAPEGQIAGDQNGNAGLKSGSQSFF
jgi:hypothetical protein